MAYAYGQAKTRCDEAPDNDGGHSGENDAVALAHHAGVDDLFANEYCYCCASRRTGEVQDCGHSYGTGGGEDAGTDYSGDGVGGIIDTINNGKADSKDNYKNEKCRLRHV